MDEGGCDDYTGSKIFCKSGWRKTIRKKRLGGGGRGRLLENAVGKSDEAGAMGDDREGGTKSAADPNDEDGSDAKAGVGSSTTT